MTITKITDKTQEGVSSTTRPNDIPSKEEIEQNPELEAIRILNLAVEQYPENYDLLIELAGYHAYPEDEDNPGDATKAIKLYETAIELQPARINAYLGLSPLYQDQQDGLEKAFELLQKAQRHMPKNWEVYDELSGICEKLSKQLVPDSN